MPNTSSTAKRPTVKEDATSSAQPVARFGSETVSVAVFKDTRTTKKGKTFEVFNVSLRRSYKKADGFFGHSQTLQGAQQMEHVPSELTDDRDIIATFEHRLQMIEQTVLQIRELLLKQRPEKDWYSVAEVAETLGKAEWTVREWCRLGRVCASKRDCGRGNAKEWIIAREELERIDNEGLLPL